jgi:hypothetical protein
MSTFTYTHEWEGLGTDFDSSAVDNVWYNANDRYAVIDWDSSLYRYNNVALDEVLEVVNSKTSVGRAAQRLKALHGPGQSLGYFHSANFDSVVDKSAKPAATREFSLATPPAPVTKAAGAVTTLSEKYTYELFFDLDGKERSQTLEDKDTLSEALASLEQAAKALGVNIVVKKAVVTFV